MAPAVHKLAFEHNHQRRPVNQLTHDEPHDTQQFRILNVRLHHLGYHPRSTEQNDEQRGEDAQQQRNRPLICQVADNFDFERVIWMQRDRGCGAVGAERGGDSVHVAGKRLMILWRELTVRCVKEREPPVLDSKVVEQGLSRRPPTAALELAW